MYLLNYLSLLCVTREDEKEKGGKRVLKKRRWGRRVLKEKRWGNRRKECWKSRDGGIEGKSVEKAEMGE